MLIPRHSLNGYGIKCNDLRFLTPLAWPTLSSSCNMGQQKLGIRDQHQGVMIIACSVMITHTYLAVNFFDECVTDNSSTDNIIGKGKWQQHQLLIIQQHIQADTATRLTLAAFLVPRSAT